LLDYLIDFLLQDEGPDLGILFCWTFLHGTEVMINETFNLNYKVILNFKSEALELILLKIMLFIFH